MQVFWRLWETVKILEDFLWNALTKDLWGFEQGERFGCSEAHTTNRLQPLYDVGESPMYNRNPFVACGCVSQTSICSKCGNFL